MNFSLSDFISVLELMDFNGIFSIYLDYFSADVSLDLILITLSFLVLLLSNSYKLSFRTFLFNYYWSYFICFINGIYYFFSIILSLFDKSFKLIYALFFKSFGTRLVVTDCVGFIESEDSYLDSFYCF